MPELYRACDVYCQPSLVEPQGQAVLEALACGRPVVATREGGPAEIVTDACGVLVDPRDTAAIADGMRRAAALPVPCPDAVSVARRHTLEHAAARVEQLLAQVFSGGDG
jgi:glycosyltransferase involved in cell wall biosynthesis